MNAARVRMLRLVPLAALLLACVATADVAYTPEVSVYSAKSCGYCKALRRYLQARDIPFEEHDINATLETRAAFFAMGGRGTPLTVIEGRWIYGFDPLRIEAALRDARAGARIAPRP